MSQIVNADNPRVVPANAPLDAAKLVDKLPYGPVNGVEAGVDPSSRRVLYNGDFVSPAEADRRRSADDVRNQQAPAVSKPTKAELDGAKGNQ